jgi:hypothetical protein
MKLLIEQHRRPKVLEVPQDDLVLAEGGAR